MEKIFGHSTLFSLMQVLQLKQYNTTQLTQLGKPSFKKNGILWKLFIKWWPPPSPYCFYEILILIFSRFFEGHIFLNKRYEIRLTPPTRLCKILIKFRFFFKGWLSLDLDQINPNSSLFSVHNATIYPTNIFTYTELLFCVCVKHTCTIAIKNKYDDWILLQRACLDASSNQ